MKKPNPASLKTGSLQVLASSRTFDQPQTTITIVNNAYVVTIVMTKWFILGFTLKHVYSECLTRPEEKMELPLLEQINNSVVPYVSFSQIPLSASKPIRSLADKIKKIVSTQLNYAAVYNNILGVLARYNSYIDKSKCSLLPRTRISRYIPKCRGPIKNYKVKINSSITSVRDISEDSKSLLSVLCESYPYLYKVISM